MQTGNDLVAGFTVLSLCLGVVGCQGSEVSSTESLALASQVPAATAAVAADMSLVGATGSAVLLDLPPGFYASTLSVDEFKEKLQEDETQFELPRWRYMGTRHGFHFVIRDGDLAKRARVFRISAFDWVVEPENALVTDSWRWQTVRWVEAIWVAPRKQYSFEYQDQHALFTPVARGEWWNGQNWDGQIGDRLMYVPWDAQEPWIAFPEQGVDQDFGVDLGFDLDLEEAFAPLLGPEIRLLEPAGVLQGLD